MSWKEWNVNRTWQGTGEEVLQRQRIPPLIVRGLKISKGTEEGKGFLCIRLKFETRGQNKEPIFKNRKGKDEKDGKETEAEHGASGQLSS